MSLGLLNCRLIQPTGDQLFFLSAVLPHRCQFGQALFSLLVARPARPRPAGGRRMLLAFPSQKDFAWFSAGAKSRRRQKSSLPPIHPRIFPKIHLTLPIDSAIEPDFAWLAMCFSRADVGTWIMHSFSIPSAGFARLMPPV